jgi:hypothetical protein
MQYRSYTSGYAMLHVHNMPEKMRCKCGVLFNYPTALHSTNKIYRAAKAAMMAAKAPPMLTEPSATAPLDGEAEDDAEVVEAPVMEAIERVVETAPEEGEVMTAVELEYPVGAAAVVAAAELMVPLPAAADSEGTAELDALALALALPE